MNAEVDWEDVERVVSTALEEDLRYGRDATSDATVPAGKIGSAELTPRAEGVLAGIDVARAVFERTVGLRLEVLAGKRDGERIRPGEPVLVVRGWLRGLLTGERTALNLLCHLSGVATLTAAWVAEVAGTGCTIRDTRKTLPGLRLLEKYAVRCGGGENHRLGLGDAILIKDNHVLAAGSVSKALAAARAHAPDLACEIEVDTLDQLDEALDEGADLVLLDNFTPEQCAEAVNRARDLPTRLEASGGITLDKARAYAVTGVDYLAIGALTHSAPGLDIGMDLR
jgi:nicotinate-nucleotide pyrophosphorylase (carboxylating)